MSNAKWCRLVKIHEQNLESVNYYITNLPQN